MGLGTGTHRPRGPMRSKGVRVLSPEQLRRVIYDTQDRVPVGVPLACAAELLQADMLVRQLHDQICELVEIAKPLEDFRLGDVITSVLVGEDRDEVRGWVWV